MLSLYNNNTPQDIQKAEKLRDLSEVDIDSQRQLWQETLHLRRQCIRDKPTAEIIKEFSGYSNPLLVNLVLLQKLRILNNLLFILDI